MRMSVSRFLALGAALLAGATLGACSSSGTPIAPTGNNNQINSFPGAPVRFIQGSPNLHLGITNADFRVDGQLVVTLNYAQATQFILSIPAGSHTVTLYDHANPTNPLFTGTTVTLSPNTKYAIVAGGDAGATLTNQKPQIFLFAEPHYNTPSGSAAMSFFNASPKAQAVGVSYNCVTGGPSCLNGIGSPAVGGSSTNNILFHSINDGWCFGAYHPTGGVVLVTGGGFPNATTSDPRNAQCPVNAVFLIGTTTAPFNNFDMFLIDAVGVVTAAPTGPSRYIVLDGQQNG
ncbi:MAG TPA: DUF4397 domain-containing protein [Candidatus Tumulicola sp.]|nr:DUF4397 domain-containing protein [Candidatus Tumulicola sp.]